MSDRTRTPPPNPLPEAERGRRPSAPPFPPREGRLGGLGLPSSPPREGWFGSTPLLALALLLVSARLAPAQVPQTYGDIKVIWFDGPHGEHSHGYEELNFVVNNTSKEKTYRVTLTAPHHQQGGDDGSHIRALSRTV